MVLYAVTIFTSAFLLFLVQPIIAKQILPWFGGSAAVWATCMVFFQVVLLAGYAYADWTTRRMAPRTQLRLHLALLVGSLLLLPIIPDSAWKPTGEENPSLRILGLLSVSIGLPYLMLATTSPLIQAWFARRYHGTLPYRLFALSNLASLLALLAYPFAVEPWVTTRVQSIAWSAAYAVFVALCAAAGLAALRAQPTAVAATGTPAEAAGAIEPPPTPGRQALWLTLAALGSFMLLAVTNHICQNVASIPFLWILPLSLYLATFIFAFDHPRWYRRRFFIALTAIVLPAMAFMFDSLELQYAVPLYLVGLFAVCMFCHGEFAQLKPAPRYLTTYYLMLSLGGAIGGLLVGLGLRYIGGRHGKSIREEMEEGRPTHSGLPGFMLISLVGLVSGASVGPEGPLAHMGAGAAARPRSLGGHAGHHRVWADRAGGRAPCQRLWDANTLQQCDTQARPRARGWA